MTHQSTIHRTLHLCGLIFLSSLAGCASTPTAETQAAKDSWEGWNRGTQSFNDTLDDNVLKPVAEGYDAITPEPIDQGITNFFSNINDIGTTINDFLQLKLTQGGMDFSRFLINTTAGLGGFIDVASMIDLPKHNEDFGQTLGFWGVPSGNYLVLPLFGPSSPRDTVGLVGDALMNPLTYVSIFGGAAVNAAVAGSRALDVTDTRSDLLSSEKILDEAAVDRYEFIKNSYEQRREYLIHDGNPPESGNGEFSLDNELDQELNSTGPTNGTSQPELTNTAPANDLPEAGTINIAPAGTHSAPPVINNPNHLLDLSAPE